MYMYIKKFANFFDLIMERNSIENKIILCDNQIFCFMFRTDINYIVNLQFYMYYFN